MAIDVYGLQNHRMFKIYTIFLTYAYVELIVILARVIREKTLWEFNFKLIRLVNKIANV